MGNICSLYNRYLDDIRKEHINLSKEDISKNNDLFVFLVEKLIAELKETSQLFRSCYQETYFSGSYYDGLRISAPTEYDLNLILRLPFNYASDLKFYHISDGTYCEMSLNKEFRRVMPPTHPRYDDFKDIPKFFLSGSLFDADKMHRWFRGLIDRVLNKFNLMQNKRAILQYGNDTIGICYSVKNTGPAHTFKVSQNGKFAFDVDFVPVFEIPTRDYFLVPKRPSDGLIYNGSIEHLWRISYSRKERDMLHNKSCAKTVIKILKLLRDTQGWEKLASYYIKTAVMHLDYQYWEFGRIADHLAESADRLQKFLMDKKLPSLYDSNHNLFEKVSPITLMNYENALKRIISLVRADPMKLYTYLGSRTSFASSPSGNELQSRFTTQSFSPEPEEDPQPPQVKSQSPSRFQRDICSIM